MKRQILSLALITALSTSAFADSYADKYFEGSHNPKLNRHEQKGLGIAKNYSSDGRMAVPPVPGDNGRITFAFGSDPSVVCAVMQVCDIALQPGEMINDLHAGDTARWNITPAISGSNGNERMHILVKPLDVGLQTTLFIATDRRTYHIRLKSHRTRYMPAVGFSY
ncbi:TrbG/VirB9 family P-type conjugative transfer protein, partial [Neisseria gonorrhoeae]